MLARVLFNVTENNFWLKVKNVGDGIVLGGGGLTRACERLATGLMNDIEIAKAKNRVITIIFNRFISRDLFFSIKKNFVRACKFLSA